MSKLFSILLNLLRLRTGPQDLPFSWPLTTLFIVLYVVEEVLTGLQLPGDSNASKSLLSLAVQMMAAGLLLRFRHLPERLPQTLLALAGTGVLLGLVAFMLLVQADPAQDQPVLALMWIMVFAWSLAVDGNIYRHALSIPMAQGVLVAVAVLAVSYVLMQLAFMPTK